MNSDNEIAFKIVIVGDQLVGKSNLLSRYTRDEFYLGTVPTVGIEFTNKYLVIDEKKVKVQIWDTAGQERFSKVSAAFYRSAVGALLVYDTTKKESFNNVEKWIKELENFADPSILTILVGNKKDLVHIREVEIEEATEFAKSKNMANIETSALTGENVQDGFENLIKEIVKLIKSQPPKPQQDYLSFKLPEERLKAKNKEENSCNC